MENYKPESHNNTDAVIAAPDSHKILLENDKVRVVEVIILPGKKEPMHTHFWPSVMIVDSSPEFKYYDEFDNCETYPARDTTDQPFVEWMDPEGLHAVENLDLEKIYHAIRIEIKKL